MDNLDAVVALYLGKTWDGSGSLLDLYDKFQQTKTDLTKDLQSRKDKSLSDSIKAGTFTF